MDNKGVPGLRKLCIFQLSTDDEHVKLGVYPEPENITYNIPIYLLLNVRFSYTVLERLYVHV